jgi:hypothetical protein
MHHDVLNVRLWVETCSTTKLVCLGRRNKLHCIALEMHNTSALALNFDDNIGTYTQSALKLSANENPKGSRCRGPRLSFFTLSALAGPDVGPHGKPQFDMEMLKRRGQATFDILRRTNP